MYNIKTTIWIIILSVGLGTIAGYRLKPNPKPETKERIVYKEGESKERIITLTKTINEPSGKIVTEVLRTEDRAEKKIESDKHAESKSMALPKYSLGVAVMLDRIRLNRDYQLMLGYRIGQSPLSIEGGFNTRKEIMLGVGLEW